MKRISLKRLRAQGDRWFEIALLGLSVCLMLWAIVSVARIGTVTALPNNLDFQATLKAYTQAVTFPGGPTGIGMPSVQGGDTTSADSLIYGTDSINIPSLGVGGFLQRQVRQFNDDLVRQSVLVGHSSPLEIQTSSIVKLRRDSENNIEVSSIPNQYALRVTYPFDENSWVRVVTSDERSTPGLIGGKGFLRFDQRSLHSSADSLNGKRCVSTLSSDTAFIYCRGATGIDVHQLYDLQLNLKKGTAGELKGVAQGSTAGKLFVDGTRWRKTHETLPLGALVESGATGQFLIGPADDGVLGGRQWINGRTRFVSVDDPQLAAFGNVGRSAHAWGRIAGTLMTSLDAALSHDLSARLRTLITMVNAGQDSPRITSAGIVVADIKTGEVRAIISWNANGDAGPHSMWEPHLMGSIVKPIIAASIFTQDPSLANLRIASAGQWVTEVAGFPLKKRFHTTVCSPQIDLTEFLRCSSNQYAAELLLRSLRRSAPMGRLVIGDTIPSVVVEHSSIANGLAVAFGVSVDSAQWRGRNAQPWMDSTDNALIADVSLMPYDVQPWLLTRRKNTRLSPDLVARYAFGSWENRWSPFGITQAFARIASGRDVQLTFLNRNDIAAQFEFGRVRPEVMYAFELVRPGMAAVVTDGTASGIAAVVRGTWSKGDSLVVLGKTGTMNDDPDTPNENGVYMKSFGLVVGRSTNGVANGDLRCGLVAVEYFEFDRPREKKALPPVHVNFARTDLIPALSDFSKRSGAC